MSPCKMAGADKCLTASIANPAINIPLFRTRSSEGKGAAYSWYCSGLGEAMGVYFPLPFCVCLCGGQLSRSQWAMLAFMGLCEEADGCERQVSSLSDAHFLVLGHDGCRNAFGLS